MRGPSQSGAYFLMAVAYSIGWNAIASELVRFATMYGRDVLLKLSLAYYMPSVPLLAVAAALDERVDARLGWARSMLIRAVAGFGGSAAILAALPLVQGALPPLLAAVAALGVTSAAAFSCSMQLAGLCDQAATVSLTLGFVASPLLLLAFQGVLRLLPCAPQQRVTLLFEAVAGVVVAGLVAATAEARRQAGWSRRSLAGSGGEQPLPELRLPLLGPQQAQQPEPGPTENGAARPVLGLEGLVAEAVSATPLSRQLSAGSATLDGDLVLPDGSSPPLRAAWPAAASLALGVLASMFLFPFLTQLPPRQLGAALPAVLFWTRCFSDIAGRLLPRLCTRPAHPAALLALALLRVCFLPFPLLYIHGRLPGWMYNDWLLVAFVCAMWLSSGALTVYSYLLVPRLVPPALVRRATAAMALAFNAACLLGLLAAVPFTAGTVGTEPSFEVLHQFDSLLHQDFALGVL